MTRVAATLPGYASVGRASEVLHLAPRSVRDLIYAGRLPSLRVGRLHYIKSGDLELERRRRLGLPLPRHTRPRHAPRSPRQPREAHSTDPELRRRRAAERAELVSRWAQRHHAETLQPRLPFLVLGVAVPVTCDACGREVRRGRMVELQADSGEAAARFCTACGRRAILEWADRRRQEANAARRMSQSLGQPTPAPAEAPGSESRVA